jgi:hypothetical protein
MSTSKIMEDSFQAVASNVCPYPAWSKSASPSAQKTK